MQIINVGNGDEELLTVDEACTELDVGYYTLRHYVKRGLISTITHAGRSYVRRAAIREYWARKLAEGEKARRGYERAHRRA